MISLFAPVKFSFLSLLTITFLLSGVGSLALGQERENKTQPLESHKERAKDSLLAASKPLNLDTVNVGNDDFFTPFIWEGTSDFENEDEMVKEQIDTRDFANDPYYMRNIDREEFEQERLLMLFRDDDKKKKGFKTWTRSTSHIALPGAIPLDEEKEDQKKVKP